MNDTIGFFEDEFSFTGVPDGSISKDIFDFNSLPQARKDPEVLGIKLRLGNSPIVKDFAELLLLSNKELDPDTQILLKSKDIYIITHAIGALRLKGKSTVKELQYHSEIQDEDCQTIDLLPNTTFKDAFQLNASLESSLKSTGKFSTSIPNNLTATLLPKQISLGGDAELQLSSDVSFLGKISMSVKFPTTQSMGVASNSCTWVLNPDKTPLLGDQFLLQTIAVPKDLERINIKIKGLAKVDPGLFKKNSEAETGTYELKIKLK